MYNIYIARVQHLHSTCELVERLGRWQAEAGLKGMPNNKYVRRQRNVDLWVIVLWGISVDMPKTVCISVDMPKTGYGSVLITLTQEVIVLHFLMHSLYYSFPLKTLTSAAHRSQFTAHRSPLTAHIVLTPLTRVALYLETDMYYITERGKLTW